MNVNESMDFGAGDALLSALQATGVITESKVLIEQSMSILTESRENSPTQYTYKNRAITWNVFKAVYMDYDTYQTYADIWHALGYLPEEFDPGIDAQSQTREANMSRYLSRIVKHFENNNKEAREVLVPYSKRKENYSKHFAGRRPAQQEVDDVEELDPYAEKPSPEDAIYPGKRNRKTRSTQILDRINSQDLMPGEFYSDFTRIPKTRWGNWLRFWEREVASVKNDRSLFGRPWKRHFVLGYQLSGALLYEVWYNSIDSTFTIHDSRGNQQQRKYPALSEAIKGIFNATAQASSADREVFTAMNNQLALSVGRSLANGLDPYMDEVQRLEKREWEKSNKARKDAEKDREDKQRKADEEEAKSKAARKEFYDKSRKKGKELMAKAGRSTADAILSGGVAGKAITATFGEWAADAALKSYVSGIMSMDAFTKKIGEVYDITNTPEAKAIKAQFYREEIDLATYVFEIRTLVARMMADKKRQEDDARRSRSGAEDIAKRARERGQQAKQANAANSGSTSIHESYGLDFLLENLDAYEAQEELVDEFTDRNTHQAMIRTIRKEAKGKVTQDIIKNSINADLIEVYDATKVTRQEFQKNSVRYFNIGRREPIVLPSDKKPFWDRVKMYFSGQRYQADFIVGFSLSKAVNIEVWYVTEPNPEYGLKDFASGEYRTNPVVSSFYVFDITSGKLLRKYVPYYRNAVQISMAKISAI